MDSPGYNWVMPKIKVNDINVYYEIKGHGEPFVLILGLAANVEENRWLIDSLAKSYMVLSFDNRGAGLTDKPDVPYSIGMMANDAAGLMKETHFSEANVIGISMGGRIALELALQYPQMVKKLILVSTTAKLVGSKRRRFILNILHWIFRDSQPRYAFNRQMEASRSYDATGRLSEIGVQTLILHGERDHSAPYNLAKEMNSGIKNSKMITFRGGHIFFLLTERSRFLDVINEFLAPK